MARLLSNDERQAEIIKVGLAALARRLATDPAASPSGEFRRRGRQALLAHLARTTPGRTQPLARRVVGLALAGLTLTLVALPILIGPELLAERARVVAGRFAWGQHQPVLSAESEQLEAVARPTMAAELVASPSPGTNGPAGPVNTVGQATPADVRSADPTPLPAPTRSPEAATDTTVPSDVSHPPARLPSTPTTGVPPALAEPSPPLLVVASPTPQPAVVPPTRTPGPAVARPSPPAPSQPDEKEKPAPPRAPEATRPPRPTRPPEPTRTPRPDEEDDEDDKDKGEEEDAPEPSRTPEPTQTPRLTETRPSTRAAEPSRTPRPAQTREPTKPPKPSD